MNLQEDFTETSIFNKKMSQWTDCIYIHLLGKYAPDVTKWCLSHNLNGLVVGLHIYSVLIKINFSH